LDGELSPAGRDLARGIGHRWPAAGLAGVFTSDLGRAVHTAELAFGASGVEIRTDARLRECNYGSMNGAPIALDRAIRLQHVDDPFPGGESYRQVVDRVGSFLVEIGALLDGHRIVAIGHSATRWALDHLVHGAPLEELVAAPFDWREGWIYQVPTSSGDRR
jgi:broad specificity phosphatase PhoE